MANEKKFVDFLGNLMQLILNTESIVPLKSGGNYKRGKEASVLMHDIFHAVQALKRDIDPPRCSLEEARRRINTEMENNPLFFTKVNLANMSIRKMTPEEGLKSILHV